MARAARAGGTTTGQRRNLGFPAAIVAIVVLGVGLIAFARSDQPGGGSPALGEHWHAAYGVYVCDRWVADLSDRGQDTLGIHTHADGLIHIHPFLAGAAGRSATLGKFFDQVGMKVTDSSITLPPGDQFGERTYKNGETKCGDEEGRVIMAYWEDAQNATGKPDDVRTSNIAGEHFEQDLGAITIAFLPKGENTIPPPPSAPGILQAATADGPIDTQADEDLTPEELEEQFQEGAGDSVPADDGATTTAPAEDGATTTAPADDGATTTAPADDGATTTAPGG
ncbi:MAG TPA: hypothetical protein VFU19_16140 [Iamia sp.]|nr:hypothetical protein [Iamia sp.]